MYPKLKLLLNPLSFALFQHLINFLRLLGAPSRASLWPLFTTMFTFKFEIKLLLCRLRHLIQVKYRYLVWPKIGSSFHLIRVLLNDRLLFALSKFLKEWYVDWSFTIWFINDLIWVLLNIFMSCRKFFHLCWAFYFSILCALPRGFLQYGYSDFLWFFGVQIGIGSCYSVGESWKLLIEGLLFRVEIEIPFLWL